MKKAELVKGIERVIEGLVIIKGCISEETCECDNKEVAKKEEAGKKEVAEKEEKIVKATGKYDVEQLKAMKYNDFKKFASSLGVDCKGTRDEIMQRILALDVEVDTEGEEAEAEAPKDKKADKKAKEEKKDNKVVSFNKAKKAEEAEEASEEDEEAPEKDEFDEQAEALAEEESAEDIIATLKDVGVKATKKNYVEKLAEALRAGLLELEDEEEDTGVEDEETDEDMEDEDEDISEDVYSPEYDPKGYNDPEKMTEERQQAILELVADILQQIEDEELTVDDMLAVIEDVCTEAEKDLLETNYTEEQLVRFFIEVQKRLVDDDGEIQEQGNPYTLNEKDFCCGHALKYSKKTKNYICEVCGQEYEAE